MLSIAIKEENSHFEQGLKIIISAWQISGIRTSAFYLPKISIAQTSPLFHWMTIGSVQDVIRFPSTPDASIGLSSATEAIKIS